METLNKITVRPRKRRRRVLWDQREWVYSKALP